MFLERVETNNGYSCSCCSYSDEYVDWRNEIIPFEELLENAYSKNLDGVISRQYEKNGVVLYGYRTSFSKTTLEVYIILGEEEYRIIANGTDKSYISKEEVLEKWQDYAPKIESLLSPKKSGNYTIRFKITEEQIKQVQKWDKCSDKNHGAAGGHLTYSFTPTGFGAILRVTCSHCNEVLDLTDYDNW